MPATISIGTQSFEFLRKNQCFFVDKSDFIREWWENQDAVTLITRPRRFGKTLNLNMLECFFSNHYEGRRDLFEGLSIWEEEKYRTMQGTYPVLSLSFANIKSTNYEEAKRSINRTIAQLYSVHAYVRSEQVLNEKDMTFFDLVNPDMPDDVAAVALQYLSDYMRRFYGKKVLIFLDEYDTPLQEAYVHGYWKEMMMFIKGMFNSTFKTNPFMERAVLTGITRVSKESIFSDLNNLMVVTTTSEMYRTQFGFTEKEVFEALDVFGKSSEKEKVKEWYDGFTFGSQRDIYNPWSITSFLKEGVYKMYWANTSSNSLVGKLIQEGRARTKMIMEDLLAGKCLETQLDEEIIFDQLQKKKGALWSMLLATGYIKVEDKVYDEKTGRFTYHLGLTNREVRMMFEDIIHGWFSDEDVPYNDFIQALLADDIDYMNLYMNQVAMQTFSFFDTGRQSQEGTELKWADPEGTDPEGTDPEGTELRRADPEGAKPAGSEQPAGADPKRADPERFYHGFVLGLIVDLAHRYHIRSNRESGFGRYDVMMEPLDKKEKAMVLEFKVFNPKKERNPEETVRNALQQIADRNYDSELISRGIPKENIRHYGFAFEGKKVLIRSSHP